MAYIGKTYKYSSEENFTTFVDALKIADEYKERMKNSKPDVKVEKNADGTFTITTSNPGHSRTLTFTPGIEFDEKISDGVTGKTTVTEEGNTFTQVQKFDDGAVTITTKREFTENDLKVTITASFFDGVALRLFKA